MGLHEFKATFLVYKLNSVPVSTQRDPVSNKTKEKQTTQQPPPPKKKNQEELERQLSIKSIDCSFRGLGLIPSPYMVTNNSL